MLNSSSSATVGKGVGGTGRPHGNKRDYRSSALQHRHVRRGFVGLRRSCLSRGFAAVALAVPSAFATSAVTPASAGAGPNGRIAYASNADGDFEIYTVKPDGTGKKRVTDNEAIDYFPAWSPNGKRIAYESNADGDFEIYKIKPNGTGKKRVTDNDAVIDAFPAWSPNGKRIAYSIDSDGDYEIFTIKSDGTNRKRVTDNETFDPSPDWRRR